MSATFANGDNVFVSRQLFSNRFGFLYAKVIAWKNHSEQRQHLLRILTKNDSTMVRIHTPP